MAIYDDEKLVGFCVYGLDDDDNQYWLMALMIDKDYQGLGYGKAAMRELIGHMKDVHGCTLIKLGHRPENKRAERLYESLGFQQVGLSGHEVIRKLDL